MWAKAPLLCQSTIVQTNVFVSTTRVWTLERHEPVYRQVIQTPNFIVGFANDTLVWTALTAEGLGCNLQHFQPGISKDVADTWNVPETWTLRAQLVFGTPTGPPRGGVEKEFAPLKERVKVYGAKNWNLFLLVLLCAQEGENVVLRADRGGQLLSRCRYMKYALNCSISTCGAKWLGLGFGKI